MGDKKQIKKSPQDVAVVSSLREFSSKGINRDLPPEAQLAFYKDMVRIRCFDLSILSIGCVGGVCSFVFVLSKRLEKLTSFFSGVDGFFSSRGLQYSFKKTSGERLLLNFDWKDENKDILVFIKNFLNKFEYEFLSK